MNGRAEEGLRIFEEMRRTNVEGNYVLFSSVLNACVNIPALEQGKQVHTHVIKSGLDIYMSVGNALVDLYGKCGCVEDSRIAFDKIDARNVVSWGALIAGHVQNGYNEAAMNIYGQMRQEGIEASEYIFSSVLKACASLAGLEKGRQIHSHVIKTMFDSDVYVGSALVDMYGKSGTVGDACQMFDKMPQRNVVSWNAMIASCAQHGHGKKALNCFEKMQFDGFKPNYITFVCLLTACSHAGLVEKGMCYFNSMTQDYGIAPGAEHYACIVDLLGRAGLLGEAEKFMKSIPLKPTASMWGALLGACRVHGNTELGRRAAECLFELDPQNSGTHVLLSNIYAAASRWDDVAKVRSVMKDIGMKKEPGRSWIGVKNKEHSFYANDKTHPLTKEIYALLENWSEQMKKVGYASDTNYVLLNVEEKQKDDFLYYHSEKLALAFGFLSIPPGIPIRIMKNLRMCGDCHTYIKFISGIVGREIVVRDTNRFHHFKGNTCSCGDYW